MKRLNLYDAAMRRLDVIFNNFDYVYVSFSGGKDSGVLLNMCLEYIRKNAPHRKLGLFHMDYEAQYSQTTEYVQRVVQANSDILEVFHCCVPFRVSTCTSMHQSYWRPWQPDLQELWVRPRPEKCYTAKDFDFFDDTL
ncbi:MAG: phosphoadenosine phosphosulfate reductase family protein, partial [Bacteroidaceae bacterium]|nr:phosphoadenosine phosphosulfate reductase family protein [Bacteroidaceae bacterium]